MAKGKGGKQDELQAIIVKKVIKKGGGHHGGAWKVAYADFVTAMMAFFLLLWLLNVSTDDALEVISSYFDPSHPKISDSRSGSGGVLGGLTMTKDGTMAEMMTKPVPPETSGYKQGQEATGEKSRNNPAIEKLEEELRQRETQRFEEAKKALEAELQRSPEMRELAKHLKIDITPEGLRIQIIDQEGKPMFAIGSAQMLPAMQTLMDAVAGVVKSMPNNISVRGHTDSHQYAPGATYTNWELSADRANSARRELLGKGIAADRLNDVMGKADREHLIAEDPLDPRNRRISIILLRETVEQAFQRGEFGDVMPEDGETGDEAYDNLPMIDDNPVGTFQKTPGNVYFP